LTSRTAVSRSVPGEKSFSHILKPLLSPLGRTAQLALDDFIRQSPAPLPLERQTIEGFGECLVPAFGIVAAQFPVPNCYLDFFALYGQIEKSAFIVAVYPA
jgi:hypothetical protein